MYRHIVLFKTTEKSLVEESCNNVIKMSHQIPGLIHAEYRVNASNFHNGYEQMGLMDFVDQSSFQSWSDHPIHLAIMERLKLKNVAIITFDYMIDQ